MKALARITTESIAIAALGGQLDCSVLPADDTVFYYSIYGGTRTATVFRTPRLLPGDPWPAGAALTSSTGRWLRPMKRAIACTTWRRERAPSISWSPGIDGTRGLRRVSRQPCAGRSATHPVQRAILWHVRRSARPQGGLDPTHVAYFLCLPRA